MINKFKKGFEFSFYFSPIGLSIVFQFVFMEIIGGKNFSDSLISCFLCCLVAANDSST